MDKKNQLGKILLQQKLVTPAELDELLRDQERHPGERLASTAMRSGKVSGEDLLRALSEQLGLPGVSLGRVAMPLLNLRLVPQEIARRHLILPIQVREDRIVLAMADPTERRVVDEIEFVTGRRVFPYVALQEELHGVIDAVYLQLARGDDYYVGAQAASSYVAAVKAGGTIPPLPTVSSMPAPERAPAASSAAARVGLLSKAPDDELGVGPLESKQRPGRAAPVASVPPGEGPFGKTLSVLPGTRKQRPAKPKILIVDDEDDIRRLLKRVLTEKGYEVIEASRGIDALKMVRDEAPHVILLDAMLPEVHGFDICRRIKGSRRYGHIPIIMVSAIYRGWRVAADLKASYGVAAFLEKPFKISDVVSHVERALEGGSEPVANEEDEELSREAADALDKGIQAYQNGDQEAAIAHLRRGVQIDPLSFKLHYHLGLLHGRCDNVFDAIQELETAVDLAPRHFSALKNLAVLYQKAGFRHKAMEMWERALGIAPDDETRQGIKEHLMSLL